MSEEGAQQGEPLVSLLFCLAIQPIVIKLLSEFNVWYIDDATIGGILSDILHDIHIIKAKGDPRDAIVLGAPVGGDVIINSVIKGV